MKTVRTVHGEQTNNTKRSGKIECNNDPSNLVDIIHYTPLKYWNDAWVFCFLLRVIYALSLSVCFFSSMNCFAFHVLYFIFVSLCAHKLLRLCQVEVCALCLMLPMSAIERHLFISIYEIFFTQNHWINSIQIIKRLTARRWVCVKFLRVMFFFSVI